MLIAAGSGFREMGARQRGEAKKPHVGAKNAAVNAILYNMMLDNMFCTVYHSDCVSVVQLGVFLVNAHHGR